MDKVLVLASGGLDSSVLIALYHNLGYEVHALYIQYRNKNRCTEISNLERLFHKLNIDSSQLHTTDILLPWSNSSCIVGKSGYSYVEMRNLVFLSLAISCAEAIGASKVGIGCIDAFEYCDTSQVFLDNMNVVADSSVGIKVEAVLKKLNKQKVYELGVKLGLILEDTHSCNMGDKPCGECQDCKDIRQLVRNDLSHCQSV